MPSSLFPLYEEYCHFVFSRLSPVSFRQKPGRNNPQGERSPRQQRMQISKMERSRLKPDAGIQKLDEERRVK